MAAGKGRPWWFWDGGSDLKRWESVAAVFVVIPFAVIPPLLSWPWWSSWVAPIAYLGTLWLFLRMQLWLSRRRRAEKPHG